MLFWPLILKKFAVSGKQVLAWILTARIYPVSLRRNVRSHHARQNSPNCLPNEKNRVRRDSNLGHPLYFNPLPPFRSASRSSFLSHRSLSLSLSLFFFLCFFFFRESRLAFSASKKSTHASKSYSRKKSRVKDIFRIFGVKLLLKSSFFISIRLSLSLSLSLTAANDRVAMILAQSSHSKLPNEPEIFRSSTRFHVEPGRMLVVGSIIVDLTPRSVWKWIIVKRSIRSSTDCERTELLSFERG